MTKGAAHGGKHCISFGFGSRLDFVLLRWIRLGRLALVMQVRFENKVRQVAVM